MANTPKNVEAIKAERLTRIVTASYLTNLAFLTQYFSTALAISHREFSFHGAQVLQSAGVDFSNHVALMSYFSRWAACVGLVKLAF